MSGLGEGVFLYGAFAFIATHLHRVHAAFRAGLGFYVLHDTLRTIATRMARERRGSAVAAVSASFSLGQSVGVAIRGSLIAVVSTTQILVLGAIGAFAVSSLFSWLRAAPSGEAAS